MRKTAALRKSIAAERREIARIRNELQETYRSASAFGRKPKINERFIELKNELQQRQRVLRIKEHQFAKLETGKKSMPLKTGKWAMPAAAPWLLKKPAMPRPGETQERYIRRRVMSYPRSWSMQAKTLRARVEWKQAQQILTERKKAGVVEKAIPIAGHPVSLATFGTAQFNKPIQVIRGERQPFRGEKVPALKKARRKPIWLRTLEKRSRRERK
jgi:hypothetical protein